MAKKLATVVKNVEEPVLTEDQVRIAAFLRWEGQMNGQPCSKEDEVRFWLEAEQELSQVKE